MNQTKRKLIRQAVETYKKIHPCGNKQTLWDCFTEINGTLVFWFNTDDDSTHLLASSNAILVPAKN